MEVAKLNDQTESLVPNGKDYKLLKRIINGKYESTSATTLKYVKLGHDITSGEDIENAIKGLADTHVAHIQPDHSQRITNWAEWTWSNDENDIGYIYEKALPGFVNIQNQINYEQHQLLKRKSYKGWALKENQKNRTLIKKIIPEIKILLKCMFYTETANPRQKMSTQEIREELLQHKNRGEINIENIPKELTIANWITTFSRKWKQFMALRNIEEAEKE
ncbi:hypothetical protein Glove_357g65 [Diversispora epigaea]|uniref:Uncharacterized protein n=1 Tax=Diversispora epigaea TaxID=1348612 RepID=A0A397HEY7_9GLOM|nr:hypothetical protein Glove_357g65 [Diversispora epigaea]